jgi:hypothetical protein
MRKVLVGLALLLCLPLIGSAQSINYYPAGERIFFTGRKDLTSGSPTAFARVSLQNLATTVFRMELAVHCDDGTDVVNGGLTVRYIVVTKAGTPTFSSATTTEAASQVGTGGASFTTFSAAVSTGTNQADLTFNAVCSLTETTLRIYWVITPIGPADGFAAYVP